MTGIKGMTRYPLETKLAAVRLHLEEKQSYAQVAEQLGIPRGRVEGWCYHYLQEGAAAFDKPIGRPRKDQSEALTLERLRMENALLKKFRTELRKSMLARRDIGSSNTTEESTL
jgi:transposase-like protein